LEIPVQATWLVQPSMKVAVQVATVTEQRAAEPAPPG
jgi:hypothetical protein